MSRGARGGRPFKGWRAGGGKLCGSAPQVEVTQDFLDDQRFFDQRDEAHRLAAFRALQGIGVPGLAYKIPPFAMGELEGRRRGALGPGDAGQGIGPTSAAAHLVGVKSVVADHLHALVGNVLGEHRQEIHGIKHFEVAVDLGIEAGAVNDGVVGVFQSDLRRGERVAQDILAELFAFGPVLRWHRAARIDVEAGVLPGAHGLDELGGDEFESQQFGKDAVAEEFL